MCPSKHLLSLLIAAASAASLCGVSRGSVFVRGAYYRLGDDDPGALAGAVGNDPTTDSFADHLDLTRTGSPRYSRDVPARGPAGDTLSMQFANIGLGGPAVLGLYGRSTSLPMDQQGLALEAWVKTGPTNLDNPTAASDALVAYNGTPGVNGFGFFQSGSNYVARIGGTDRKLGPAEVGVWHHLAYVQNFGTADYFYDGKLVQETTTDPAPTLATAGFWVGGEAPAAASPQFLFNGWVDEVRYQVFNPIAAGAFDPTSFLISVPEPSTAAVMAVGLLLVTRRRRPIDPRGGARQ